MIDNRRVIAWTPFGRTNTYSILIKYLERDVKRGLVDEVWAYMNTSPEGQEHDVAYAHELADTYPWFHLKERPADCPRRHPKQLNTGYAYRYFTDPDAVYIRLDDDIVYLHDDFVTNLVRARVAWGATTLAAFPIIINNAVCSYFLQTMGLVPGADDGWPVVGIPYCMDEVGWKSGDLAVKLHQLLIDNIKAGTVHDMFMHHPVQLGPGQQFSVSSFATLGSDYATFEPVGNIGQEEEYWHSVHRPQELGVRNAIVPDALVSHWSFMHQHTELAASGLLEEYRKLAEALDG